MYKYNVSVNNTTLCFIYNKNSILSARHVSTFTRSSSGSLRKQILEPTMHWNTDSSRICFLREPEDDLVKVETCRPNSIPFLLFIKQSVVLLTYTLYLYVITLRDGKQTPHMVKIVQKNIGNFEIPSKFMSFFLRRTKYFVAWKNAKGTPPLHLYSNFNSFVVLRRAHVAKHYTQEYGFFSKVTMVNANAPQCYVEVHYLSCT